MSLALCASRLAAQGPLEERAAPLSSAETEGATTNTTGSGTNGKIPRWTGATALGNSIISQINGKIGIGNANPPSLLTVDGKDAAAATIRGANSSSGKGVLGTSVSGTGVAGTSTSGVAVQGTVTGANNANAAILGQTSSKADNASGVTGRLTSTSPGKGAAAVRGINNSSDPTSYGVFGSSSSTDSGSGGTHSSIGIRGEGNTGVSGFGDTGVEGSGSVGVMGSGSVAGVSGYNAGSGDNHYGVYGSSPNAIGVFGAGNRGVEGQSSDGAGVFGSTLTGTGVAGASGSGAGVTGQSTNHFGVYGISTNSYAGYFDGNVHVNGTLSKSAGSFEIDHPLDPEHKLLAHSFVESPDMMNIYNGNVQLDASGEATVQMPDYFSALNKEFRYQLTCMGGFAPVYVAQEIESNRFQIAGGKPGLKISWQVTGVRHDAYADAHRIAVEKNKSAEQMAGYLRPKPVGQPPERAIGRMPNETAPNGETSQVAAK